MALEELRYIAVEGVIGVGKTSLTARLGQTLGARALYEEFEKNPFLEDFYADSDRYAFQTQLFFLMGRYKQQQQLHQIDLFQDCIVSDYLFAKDRIFATLTLSDREMKLYDGIATLMERDIVKADLVIYLQSSTSHLMNYIRKRARKMERNISEDYIQTLNELYNDFFFHYNDSPLLVINTDEIDFVHDENDYKDVLYEINQHSSGTRYYIPHKSR